MAIVDLDTILDALADGLTIEGAAKRYRITPDEVRAIVKEATERCYDGAYLREHWMLEDRRLFAMEMKFYHLAMDEGNPAHAMVAVKTSERRAVLAGANMPQAHVLQISPVQPQTKTSTERIRNALDTVLHISPRERQLQDKKSYGEEPMT
jgi:hypothetical protein